MDMKKKLLLSMILLALCLIQASASTYYFKIQLSKADGTPGDWSGYIPVAAENEKVVDGNKQYDYPNGLRTLLNGGKVKDEANKEYELPKTTDNKGDKTKIYGIVFANGKGRNITTTDGKQEENILEGDEYKAWETIRPYIKYLELREYELATYTGKGYFMDMHNVEELELPQLGMNVGDGDEHCQYYFANADKLKKITIWIDNTTKKVDITDDKANNKTLLNRVGKYMFANCYNLSTKYINRLIRDVTEIKDYAFKVDPDNRKHCPDEADNTIIDIPSTVTKIGSRAFYNRVKVTGLTIQGNGSLEIGSEAFRGCEQLNDLKLNQAKITSLGTGVFGDCRSMTDEFVNGVLQNYADNGKNGENRVTKIPAFLFFGCNGQKGFDGKETVCTFTNLNIPAQFSEIGDCAFASTGDDVIKLRTITVNRGEAPKCLQNSGDRYENVDPKNKKVFNELDPNLTTVIFANDAQNSYEENKTTGQKTGFVSYMTDNSEFQYLLTKDIYSDHTGYINVPQQHAIVRLHRTLKEGWNTICLPFGVNYRYCSLWGEDYKAKQAYNASIIVNGLTHSTGVTSDDFTMGVYRGYWKEGQTFMFLHYTNFKDYPLDFCETFLVKMRPEDIAKAEKEKDDKGVHTYTFTNVDLNYRWHADGTSGNEGNWTLVKAYSANEMLGQVKPFDGNVNSDATPFKDKATYDDYVFKGSLVQRTGTVGDGIITTDDYFFQSKDGKMKLYPYTNGQKYGIRGFSGWFHKTENNKSKASELSLSLFDDGSTTPIETVKVDDLNRDTSGKVYSISGVLMKNNAADLNNLPKGIYVVNGKKYVVK